MKLSARGLNILIPPAGLIDVDAEKGRIEKQMKKTEKDFEKVSKKLSNPKFVENADPEVVTRVREESEELSSKLDDLKSALSRLS